MDVGVYSYPQGDAILIDKIVNEFLSQGRFDKLRKECMSDADTKPAYQNLQQRVENTVSQFLKKQVWRPDLNKNQLRDSLRKHILESKFFDAGINRIVDQVVNPNLLATVFLPEVEEVVYNYLSIPRPSDKNQKRGSSDERFKPSGRDYEYSTSLAHEQLDKNCSVGTERSEGGADQRKENHLGDEEYKPKDLARRKSTSAELSSELIKMEPEDRVDERIKSEPQEQAIGTPLPVEKLESVSDESQESLNRMAVEGLHITEPDAAPPPPDSDDSIPLEINEKSMSESRDSEDSIMNQMSPISQGRLTPELEEEKAEEKKPLTFVGRIPKIKREDSESSKSSKAKEDAARKEKLDVKIVYSSDESDSSKSYGKSDSDEKRRRSEKASKEERRRDDSEKRDRDRNSGSRDRKREKSKDRHKDRGRERSRDRHKKSSSSSSSSQQRERSSSHRKSSHHHKDSKSRRKEEEKKKSKSTDDHGKEKMKKESRRSTDRDSNERERDKSSGSRAQGDCRKREKEQQKAEEGKGESSQKEGEEMEQEGDVFLGAKEEGSPEGGRISGETEATAAAGDNSDSLDFNELFRTGALTRIEFAKLTDDFYVKFNSTGFRYFEDWEKTKLDCEEEFKEFVDEAENDLSLLSDDDSDSDFEDRFGEENRRTIGNLLKGLGNFPRSIMLDPATSEFYRWTSADFFRKFSKKADKRKRRRTEKESDESIKENIDRGEKRRALHLKLLNKYRRKAMRMGRSRRRHRRPGCWGIKEQNENRGVSKKRFFNGTSKAESFFAARLAGDNLVEPEHASVPESVNSVNMFGGGGVTLPDSPEENVDWAGSQKRGGGGERGGADRTGTNLAKSMPLHLPPSPDSDDINNGITPKHMTVFGKRINKEIEDGGTPKKQKRRNYSQKYDSQDLYKPRPILNSSRTRGKERVSDAVRLDSPISR